MDAREARGIALLREWLSPTQRAQFDASKYFEVVGCDSGRRYRIHYGRVTNVHQIDEAGQPVMGWCFVPSGGLVAGDVMLVQKIALETNEQATLAVANRFNVQAPGGGPPALLPDARALLETYHVAMLVRQPDHQTSAGGSPASLHADLIGREGTRGNRHAGAVFFYLKTQPFEAVHDKICNPWRSVVGNDARRSSESAGRRRGSRVLRAILSDRELPELRTRQPALSQRSLPKRLAGQLCPGVSSLPPPSASPSSRVREAGSIPSLARELANPLRFD